MTHRVTVVLALIGVALAACVMAGCSDGASPTLATLRQLSPVPTATAPPTPTATETPPTPTEAESALAEPDPIATARPAPQLRQLTDDGCCVNPFWSADSQVVEFIDAPPDGALGVYGVDVTLVGSPILITERIVNTTGNGAYYVYPYRNTTVLEEIASGTRYVIRSGGRPVSAAPDGQHVLWQVFDRRGDYDRRRSQTWVADLDGSSARVVGETLGMGESQWIDDRRILLIGLPNDDPAFVSIAALTLGDAESRDTLIELAQVARPKGTLLSPSGGWLGYYLSFQLDPKDDGLWIAPTDGNQLPRKLDFFGAYRWRSDTRLLYVPMEPGAGTHTLWEYDVINDEGFQLTDSARSPFKIAANDWAVSWDGRYVAFVSATDHNLWLIDLQP